MSIRRYHTHFFRAVSLALVAFMVVASSRGLAPSICLTLGAPACDSGACAKPGNDEVRSLHPCCARTVTEQGESPAPVRSGDNPGCAFCFLAKACLETVQPFDHPYWREVPYVPYAGDAGLLDLPHVAGAIQGRAPPAFS